MRAAVIGFFDANESWLARVLDEARSAGALAFDGSAENAARALVSGLEGAMLLSRPYGDLVRFDAAAERLLATLAAPAADR
jgi:TetR/AcrR family transcriptional repressor of nem operon